MSFWRPVWELVIHVLIGSFLFAIIFAPAIALDLLISWQQANLEISDFLLRLLTVTKYTIACIDVALYVTYMLRMGWSFLKSIF